MRVVTVLVKDHDGAAEDQDDQVAALGVTAAVPAPAASTRISSTAGARVAFSSVHLLF